MKLFLSSFFSQTADLLPPFLGDDLAARTVAFIPTAARHEKVRFYVEAARKAFARLGFALEEVDVSTESPTRCGDVLERADLLYVSGGNTFFLLQAMQESGMDAVLRDLIRQGKPYVGESAGSILMAPDIAYVQTMDDMRAAPRLAGTLGLGVVAFHPLPHDGCLPFKRATAGIRKAYGEAIPLVPIDNSQAILVDEAGMRIV